jgi:Ca-activated chloride channel family protein
MLSDYNMLRPDDERIKEVTTLGLTYNLLTAYTSFVAVDNAVRNKSGELTSINQPLPLPQGVSDLAVAGRAGRIRSAKPGSIGGMFFAKKKEALMEQEAFSPEEDKKDMEVIKVLSTSGISKAEVKKVAVRNMLKIDHCRHKVIKPLKVKIVIDKRGRVKSVEVLSPGIKGGKAEKCIVQEIRKWRFTPFQKGSGANAVVSFG